MCTRVLSELSSALVSIVFPSKVRSTQGLQPKLATGQKPDVNQSRILILSCHKTIPKFQGPDWAADVFYPSPEGSQSLESVRLQVQGSRRPSVPWIPGDRFPWAELEESTRKDWQSLQLIPERESRLCLNSGLIGNEMVQPPLTSTSAWISKIIHHHFYHLHPARPNFPFPISWRRYPQSPVER